MCVGKHLEDVIFGGRSGAKNSEGVFTNLGILRIQELMF